MTCVCFIKLKQIWLPTGGRAHCTAQTAKGSFEGKGFSASNSFSGHACHGKLTTMILIIKKLKKTYESPQCPSFELRFFNNIWHAWHCIMQVRKERAELLVTHTPNAWLAKVFFPYPELLCTGGAAVPDQQFSRSYSYTWLHGFVHLSAEPLNFDAYW